jgi:predicted metal-dependent hydrolase
MAAVSFTELFIVFVLAVIILLYIRQYYGEVEYVRARLDGRKYLMRKLPDSQQAAELMASINADLQTLIKHVLAKYPDRADVRRLYDNYSPESLSEGGTEIGFTSYSLNKGEKIVLCLRQRDNALVDKNVLMYVAVHELGHLASKSVGHTDEFWANFRFLLREAMAIGLYAKVDFARKPTSYCGVTISSSVV